MTLIAGYIINSCPVLIGDVLISSARAPGPSVSLPSWHTDTRAPVGDQLQIVGMTQKVNIISDQVCFAWAGSHVQARLFARSLTEHINEHGVGHVKMLEFLKSIDGADRSDLQCILNTVDGGLLKRYQLGASEYECDGLMVQTGGSGVGHFLDAISFFFKQPSSVDKSAYAILAPGLSYIASAFGEQIFTGGGLSDGWGGAFELAFYANGRFQKIDDVLYLFWTATENPDGSILLKPYPYIVKTNYFDETLVVHVADNSCPNPSTRIYNISPLGKNDCGRHHPHFSFTYLVNFILLDKADGNKLGVTNVRTKDSSAGCTIDQREGALHLEFTSNFIDMLCSDSFGKGRTRLSNA